MFKKTLEKFKDLLKLANKEHLKTVNGDIEKRFVEKDGALPSLEVIQSVVNNSVDEIEDVLNEKRYEVVSFGKDANINEDDIREFAGVFRVTVSGDQSRDTDNIHYVKIQAKAFLDKAERETDLAKKQMYKTMGEATLMYSDKLRLELRLRPEGKEANDIINKEIENNDLSRLERFKEWAKENMVGLSAIAITIAGVITSIAGVAKSLGPLLAPLMSLLATIISWGEKGLLWLSQNLYLLVIVAVYFIYDYWMKKNK